MDDRPVIDTQADPNNLPSQGSETDIGAQIEPNRPTSQNPETDVEAQPTRPEPQTSEPVYNEDALRHAVVALCSLILGLMLVALQIWGLVAAIRGRQFKGLKVKWCSPTFRDFALAVTTGNCKKYAVIDSSSNGIGCIELPAHQQEKWLLGTTIALVVSLACEITDFILLKGTFPDKEQKKKRKCREVVRVQRPWTTMFIGLIILMFLVKAGWDNANKLPDGVTDVVWIYRKEPTAKLGRVCQGRLTAPGLRGTNIGWFDALFESWGKLWNGSVV